MTQHTPKLLLPPLVQSTPISFAVDSAPKDDVVSTSGYKPFDLLIHTATRQWDLNFHRTPPALKDLSAPATAILPPISKMVPEESFENVTSKFFPTTQVKPEPRPTPEQPERRRSEGNATDEVVLASFSARKQRQRAGPSCHACRSRKIKCDAQMILFASGESSQQYFRPEFVDSWIDGCSLLGVSSADPEWLVFEVVNADKATKPHILIKFKKCSACTKRSCSCFFDKFALSRLDVERFKVETLARVQQTPEQPQTAISPTSQPRPPEVKFRKHKVAERGADSGHRRSSCSVCRSRKIKCAKKPDDEKCLYCSRRGIHCVMP